MRKDIAVAKQVTAMQDLVDSVGRLADGMAVVNERLMRLEAALIANGLTFDEDPPTASRSKTYKGTAETLSSSKK